MSESSNQPERSLEDLQDDDREICTEDRWRKVGRPKSPAKPPPPELCAFPVEVVIKVMSHCPSTYDLFKLASTCKTLHEIYRGLGQLRPETIRAFFKGLMTNFLHRFGKNISDHYFWIIRFRRLRRRRAFKRLSLAKIENIIMNLFFDEDGYYRSIPWQSRNFRHFSRTLDDAEVLVNAFATEAWNNTNAFKDLGYLRGPQYGDDEDPETIVLTPSERTRFLTCVFRYQHYCNMFFYQDEILFNTNTLLRRQFFGEVQYIGDWIGVLRFHSLVTFLNTFYRRVIHTMRCSPIAEIRTWGSEEEVGYFFSLSFIEIIRLVHLLLCNGMRVFAKINRMDIYSRNKFLLEVLYKLRSTRLPAITVAGFDVAGQGTEGEKTWTPWPYTDEVLKPENEQSLRSAIMFWDRERLAKLRKATPEETQSSHP